MTTSINKDIEIEFSVIRSPVKKLAKYGDYEPIIRWDFWYSCAYCTLTEVEALGLSYQIDHYYPSSTTIGLPLKTTYTNLMYSCNKCNREKSDFPDDQWMSTNPEVIVLRPDCDNFREHIIFNENGISPLSNKGQFHIDFFGLDLDPMKTIYTKRFSIDTEQKRIQNLLEEIDPKNMIDQVPKELRQKIIQIYNGLEDQFKKIRGIIDVKCTEFEEINIVKNLEENIERMSNASPLINEYKSDNRKKIMSVRRQELRKIRAVTP